MAYNNQLRRSIRHPAGAQNLYGLDPEGRKTHLIKHMYGAWQLPTVPLARYHGKRQTHPHYGPPSSEQLAWLPVAFIQREPPLYYGKPSPPYLPPLLDLDLAILDALISRPRGSLNAAGVDTQPLLQIADGVWSVFVIYTTGNGLYAHEFRILTSIPWEDFESVARTYLQMWLSDCGLGYRVRRNGCLGELRALKHSEDWRRAMLRVCQVAEDGLGGELVIFNLNAIPGLSNDTPDLDPYSFQYPSVDELLQQLDLTETAPGDLTFLNKKECQGLRIAGMSHVDDFMMLSPVELSIVSVIIPEKISVIYCLAMRLIAQVHNENNDDIKSITNIRAMREQLRSVL